ncbi:MAG: hypothetical protein H8E84_00560 [Flavobacteriales bacterium]|nr:hypothetical protein [Flavobacteriales bacterium]
MAKNYGKRLRLSKDEEELIYQHRAAPLENINGNTALDLHIKERGIGKDDIVSVKHWQAANGEYRFSIVTKDNIDTSQIFKSVQTLISDYAPTYPKINYSKGEHLLVVNPADIHIGKYANERETGDKYNSDIAVQRVMEGVLGLIDKAKGFNIDRILFCIGNDVMHIDNVYGSTTKGTFQDTDGKWWEHYEIALKLYVRCIEILREIAPIDVVHSMSNHDYQSGFHLAHSLKAWFRNCPEITIDAGVSHRKYYKYGNTLIGLEHGDGAKMANLPLLMAQEQPKLWADTKYRYWYLHHLHHKVKHKWLDAKDYIGVSVEYLRSPSSSDSWHSRKGFCSQKAVEGFVHEKKSGQVARLVHYF